MPANSVIQFRRGPASQWTSVNPTLANGEPGYETDTGKEKRGDGTTAWASLGYTGSGSYVPQGDLAVSILNPTFAAPLDGTTNAAAALASAITATPVGGTLDLGGRTFAVSSALAGSKRMTLQNGALVGTTNAVLSVSAADFTCRNMSFSRSTTAASSGDSLSQRSCVTVNAARFRSIDCTYADANHACLYLSHSTCNGSEVRGGSMSNSIARQNGSHIYVAAGATGNTDITVEGVTVTGTGAPDGILFYDSSRCTIRRCNVSNLSKLPTVTVTGWSVVSGNVYRATDRTDGSTRIIKNGATQLTEDIVTPTAPGTNNWGIDSGFVYLNLGGTNPSSATITSEIVSGYGLMFYGTSNGFTTMSDNLVDGNIVRDVDGFGIYMQLAYAGAHNNQTRGNRLRNVCRSGSQSNTLPFAGIGWTGGTNSLMSGDSIETVGDSTHVVPGVRMFTGGVSTTSTGKAIGVSVAGATTHGFHVSGTDWSFLGCHAEGSTLNGFHCIPVTTTDAMTHNLQGCTATGNTQNGVNADASSFAGAKLRVNVNGGLFSGNTQRGLQFYNVQDSRVVGATARDNGSTSFPQIYVRGTSVRTIVDNCLIATTVAGVGLTVDSTATETVIGANNYNSGPTTPTNVGTWVQVAGTKTLGATYAGTGSPESVVGGRIGDVYRRLDGGAGTSTYTKESGTGNTGWVAK